MNPPRNPRITRRRFLRGALGVGVAGLGSYEWAKRVEPFWVQVEHIEIPLRHLPRAFDGFQIAQISDIHIENNGMPDRFPGVCDLVSGLGADCIVVTGDFITFPTIWSRGYFAKHLPRLKAREGVFGVRGNHDVRFEADISLFDVQAAMREGGVRELCNGVHTFERGGAKLHLAGLDDPRLGKPDLEAVEAQIEPGDAAVLLAHEPDFALDYAQNEKFGLMLSGHSHGGQVCLPGGFVIHVPPLSQRFPRGLYQTQGMWHYTNRGLGTVGPSMRFFSRPEVSLFTLKTS